MDGVHDMGGRAGYGPVVREENEPVWHEEWEKTVFSLFPSMALVDAFTLDGFRHEIEKIPPADYITSTYYEHWIHAAQAHGVAAGIFDEADLERRTRHYLAHPDEPLPATQPTELTQIFDGMYRGGMSCLRASDQPPRFAVGDRVRVTISAAKGHTRKAGYTRGRVGEVVLAHGAYVFPDTNAHGGGEQPQHVYTIRFRAEDLWGPDAEPNETVCWDAFEPYLEPADQR